MVDQVAGEQNQVGIEPAGFLHDAFHGLAAGEGADVQFVKDEVRPADAVPGRVGPVEAVEPDDGGGGVDAGATITGGGGCRGGGGAIGGGVV